MSLRACVADTTIGWLLILRRALGISDLGTESARETRFAGGCRASGKHEEDGLGEGVHGWIEDVEVDVGVELIDFL